MGPAYDAKAHLSEIQLAVHPHSCFEAFRLPLEIPRSFLDYLICYVLGAFAVGIATVGAMMRDRLR